MVSDRSSTCDHKSSESIDNVGDAGGGGDAGDTGEFIGQNGPPGIGTAWTLR